MKGTDIRLLERIGDTAHRLGALLRKAEISGVLGEYRGATGKLMEEDLRELVGWVDLRAEAGRRNIALNPPDLKAR